MIPGKKFRGGAGNRWLNPQLHERVFRVGAEPEEPLPQPVTSTVRVNVSGLTTTNTITDFAVPGGGPYAIIACWSSETASVPSISGVTWNSRSFTLAAAEQDGSSIQRVEMWYLLNADPGVTSDLTVTYSSSDVTGLIAYCVQGIMQEAPEATATQATGSKPITTSIGTHAGGALILDAVTEATGSTSTPTETDQILIAQQQISSDSVSSSSRLAGPVGTYSMGWDFASASVRNVHVLAAWRPVDNPQPLNSKFVLGYDFSGIDSTVTVVGSGIDTVTDSSGNGNHGTQTTDARRLLHGAAMINGRTVADSGGSSSRHLILPASITGFTQEGQPPFHLIAVVRVRTWTSATDICHFLTGGGSLRTAIRLSTSSGNRIQAIFPASGAGSVAVLSAGTALATSTTYIVEAVADASNNGVVFVNDGTPGFNLGGVADSGEALPTRRLYGLSSAFDGEVAAFYLFNADLSPSERTEWTTFLAQRWGVTL